MKSLLSKLVVVVPLATALSATAAAAFSSGINGYSGKQGQICSLCHTGGVAPEVRLEQVPPVAIEPGAIATFRFVVRSTRPTVQTAAGLNVAASAGSLAVVAGEGTKILSSELTHSAFKNNDENGEAAWLFTWRAPDAAGTYTLFGAGNSVNKRDGSVGDLPDKTMLQVVVAAAPPTPTATETSTEPPIATATPTATPTTAVETTTPTEIPATPTPTATGTATMIVVSACTGDCDASRDVTVDEIVKGVNIALGNLPVEECERFDRNLDAAVTVDEIVDGIQRALNGCV